MTVFIVLMETGGFAGVFLISVGLNVTRQGWSDGLGVCFDADRADEGLAVPDLVALEPAALVGKIPARSMHLRVFENRSNQASMTFGTLQPKMVGPARALSTLCSSSSLEKGSHLGVEISFLDSASPGKIEMRVLISAAVYEPMMICLAPFLVRLKLDLTSLFSLLLTSRRFGMV